MRRQRSPAGLPGQDAFPREDAFFVAFLAAVFLAGPFLDADLFDADLFDAVFVAAFFVADLFAFPPPSSALRVRSFWRLPVLPAWWPLASSREACRAASRSTTLPSSSSVSSG